MNDGSSVDLCSYDHDQQAQIKPAKSEFELGCLRRSVRHALARLITISESVSQGKILEGSGVEARNRREFELPLI